MNNDELNGARRWSGLVQALCQGDISSSRIVILPPAAGSPSQGADAPARRAAGLYFIEVGALELGRAVLMTLTLNRFEEIEFLRNVHRPRAGSLGRARLPHVGQAMVAGETPHPGIGSNPEGYVGLSCSDVGAALVTCLG